MVLLKVRPVWCARMRDATFWAQSSKSCWCVAMQAPAKSGENEPDDHVIARIIQECLYKVNKDMAFMDFGISADQFDKIRAMEETDIDAFLQYVASELIGSRTKKKRIEKRAQLLRSDLEKWKEYIEKFDPETYEPLQIENNASAEAEGTSKKRKKGQDGNSSVAKKAKTQDGGNDGKLDDSSVKEETGKQGARKRKRTSMKKKKKTTHPEKISTTEREQLVEDAKAKFEMEKADVLEDIPEDYKAQWGKVKFARWKKVVRPVLVVGPYHVSYHTEMRKGWMKMFHNVR